MKKSLKFIFLSCVALLALATFSIDRIYAYGEIEFPDEYGERYSYKKECQKIVNITNEEHHPHLCIMGSTHIREQTKIICIYEKDAIGCYGGGVLQNPKVCTPYNPC